MAFASVSGYGSLLCSTSRGRLRLVATNCACWSPILPQTNGQEAIQCGRCGALLLVDQNSSTRLRKMACLVQSVLCPRLTWKSRAHKLKIIAGCQLAARFEALPGVSFE